jgi:short-subunit dehydrogenase
LDLSGRIALLTGASRGLGRALALRLSAAGCRLALCARQESALDQTVDDVRRIGSAEARAFPADLRTTMGLSDLVARVENDLGPIDLLISNAGSAIVGPLVTVPVPAIQASFALNALAPTILASEMLRRMLPRRQGMLVFVGSGVGLRGLPDYAAYSASKAAIGPLADALRVELRGTGINVLTVYPGKLRTDFDAHAEYFGSARHPSAGGRDPGVVAGRVIRAIRRDRRVLIVGCGPLTAGVLSRFAPGLVDRLLAARSRRQLTSTPGGSQ